MSIPFGKLPPSRTLRRARQGKLMGLGEEIKLKLFLLPHAEAIRRDLIKKAYTHLLMTGKIALVHLNEFSDYCTRLLKTEEETKKQTPK